MLNKRVTVNDLVREYKANKIELNQCIHELSTLFRNKYLNKYNKVAHIVNNASAHSKTSDLYTVFLKTIHYSLQKFSFDTHDGRGENKISFVPYFSEQFERRFINFQKSLHIEAKKASNSESLDAILSKDKNKKNTFEEQFASVSFEKCSDLNQKQLEAYLKKNLTKRQYKIFYLKLKGRTNDYVGYHMNEPCSHEKIRMEWNEITGKLKGLLEQRINIAAENIQ